MIIQILINGVQLDEDEDLDPSKEVTRISTDEEDSSTTEEEKSSRDIGVGVYESSLPRINELELSPEFIRGSVGSPGVPGRPILHLPGR